MENNSLNNKGVIVGPTTAGKCNKANYNPNNKLSLYILITIMIIVAMAIGIINGRNIKEIIETFLTANP